MGTRRKKYFFLVMFNLFLNHDFNISVVVFKMKDTNFKTGQTSAKEGGEPFSLPGTNG